MEAHRRTAGRLIMLNDGTFIASGAEYMHVLDGGSEMDMSLEEYERRYGAGRTAIACPPVGRAVPRPPSPVPDRRTALECLAGFLRDNRGRWVVRRAGSR